MPRPARSSLLDQEIAKLAMEMGQKVAALVRRHIGEQVAATIAGEPARARVAPSERSPSRRARRTSSINDALLSQVLDVIRKSPGLRSEQIYKQLPLPSETVKAALAKLREKNEVKTTGTRRAMAYRAA